MSKEAVVGFTIRLTQDAELRARVNADPSGAAQVHEGAKAGFHFTADELRQITNAMQFMDAAAMDTAIAEKMRGADKVQIAELGAAHGWDFSAHDLEIIEEESMRELTDEELEQIAGGISFPNVCRTPPYGIPIPYPKW